jgi:cellulose synthase/poly-beta-1,6-N-acetylglucosamine synthase-like glycosyltransferase
MSRNRGFMSLGNLNHKVDAISLKQGINVVIPTYNHKNLLNTSTDNFFKPLQYTSPFFSIITPTYNRPHLLRRAITHVIGQNFKM